MVKVKTCSFTLCRSNLLVEICPWLIEHEVYHVGEHKHPIPSASGLQNSLLQARAAEYRTPGRWKRKEQLPNAQVFHESVNNDGANLTNLRRLFHNLAPSWPNMLSQAKAEEKRTPGHGEPRGTNAQLPKDSYPRITNLEKILTLSKLLNFTS
jgi:hypothetical protein